jgi:hypothetical protein
MPLVQLPAQMLLLLRSFFHFNYLQIPREARRIKKKKKKKREKKARIGSKSRRKNWQARASCTTYTLRI